MESDGPAVAVAGVAVVVAAPEGAPSGVAAGVWAGVLRAGTNTSDDAASDSQRDGKRLFFLMFSRKTSTFQAMVGRCTFPTARGPEVCQAAVCRCRQLSAGQAAYGHSLPVYTDDCTRQLVRGIKDGSNLEVFGPNWLYSIGETREKEAGYHQVVIGVRGRARDYYGVQRRFAPRGDPPVHRQRVVKPGLSPRTSGEIETAVAAKADFIVTGDNGLFSIPVYETTRVASVREVFEGLSGGPMDKPSG